MKNYFKSNEEEKEYSYSTLPLKVESEIQFKGEKNDLQLTWDQQVVSLGKQKTQKETSYPAADSKHEMNLRTVL